ncbi:MAG: TIGR03118 family protein [Acidobacteria bacterium]|nr:MAG: TIGR03118 family protein [Acidobacteriota bacterium]
MVHHLRNKDHQGGRLLSLVLVCLLGLLALAGTHAKLAGPFAALKASAQQIVPEATPTPTPGTRYRQTNLVSDLPGFALIQDPLVVNPWGVAMTSSSPFWLANNGTSTSSLYRGDVGSIVFFKQPGMPNITIPETPPSITGAVANNGGTSDFFVTSGSASARANFLFASLSGKIWGWSPNVPAAGSTVATQAASQPGHVYTGLAIANNSTANFLYAADFKNGTIDVFNSSFALQPTASFPFADPTIPTTVGNTFHPFNIQTLGGSLYVMYAKFDPVTGMDIDGPGNGFVRRFNTNGVRDLTFGINNGPLNSPWGAVIAPASFGVFGGALLIGNFGEGGASINAFNATTGAFLGSLQNESGDEIEIDELWTLTFGNGGNGGDPNTLYFSAGPGEEEHGLFGSLKPVSTFQTSTVQLSGDNFQIGEGGGDIQITVTRTGDVSAAATVNFATFDESQPGHATQKRDYEIAVGTLRFNPGETSKTFRILLVDDKFVEGDESVDMALVNPTGAGLGSPNMAELTITDNDSAPSTTNPIDGTSFFVRQQYLDFLAREPDTAGFNAWVSLLNGCSSQNNNPSCDRVTVSQSFFGSPEALSRGYFAIRFYRAAFGRDPLYGEYMGDLQRLSGSTPDETAAFKAAFATDFVQRNEFRATLDALTNAQFVDRLIANTGVAFSNRDAQVAALDAMTKTRAQVLMETVEATQFVQNATTLNRAFVLAEYFGYLRRDPEAAGFNAWLNFLTAHPGDFRTMVNGFVNSLEYRQRFGAS